MQRKVEEEICKFGGGNRKKDKCMCVVELRREEGWKKEGSEEGY